jgi:hypothetical protein
MAGKSRLVDQRRLRAKKRRRAFFVSLYLFFALGLIICGVSLISSLAVFQIHDVRVDGAERISPLVIESIARDALSGEYVWLFPRSNTFIYPSDTIEEVILAMPLIESVDISRRGFSALDVEITERVEVARWCSASLTCYSIDENGFIFAETASSSTFVYQGLIEGDPVGQNLLTEEKFKSMEFFMREIRNLSLAPVEAHLFANGYLDVILRGGGKLIIYTEDDLSGVLANLESAIRDREAIPSLDAFLSTLLYIRLDTGDKVTYKKK